MKRKLISYDVFKNLEESSLTHVEKELIEAEELLAASLGLDEVQLHAFGESDVTYKTSDDNFIHATYTVSDNQVILENIELLVVEEESAKSAARQTISVMIDKLLENDNNAASELFESYMSMPSVKREMSVNEAVKIGKKKSPLAGKKQSPATILKRKLARNAKISRMSPAERAAKLGRPKGKKSGKAKFYASKLKPKTMKEWARMCENVLGYINFVENGSVLSETAVKSDDNGNVSAVAMPSSKNRKEGKVLSMGFKTMDTELKVLRGNMKNISEDQTFVKAMSDLKRYNNISDNRALEETLEAIVSRWPDILYISETELAQQIDSALSSASVSNYDDDTCSFMAEAILRTAHNVFTDRVRKIAHLAGYGKDVSSDCNDCEDAYREFSSVSQNLFNQLDENHNNEVRIFGDLYSALNDIYRIANESGDEATRVEVADMMRECYAIMNSTRLPDMELAESIADFLAELIESEGGDHSQKGWDQGVEIDALGDNSMTTWNAKQYAVPSNNSGDWRDAAPVSDGKSYHGNSNEMGHNALANYGKDTWPNVQNPFTPKSLFAKMKEKSVIDDEGLGSFQKDTWPNLHNPMAPKPVMPKMVEGYGQSFDGTRYGKVDNSSQIAIPRQMINDAEIQINSARRKGDKELAFRLARKLKDDLTQFGYAWQRDPHATDLIQQK